MKNTCWLLFTLLIVGSSSNLFAQSDWDTYPVREIAALVKQEQDLKNKTPKSDIVVSADPFPSKTIVTYIGSKRSASKYTRLFVKLWAESKGVPQNADMLVDEYLFKENETEYWIPVHKLVAPALEKDLQPGDQIGVYYFYLGGFNPRNLQKKESNNDKSAPVEEDSFRWIFAIEKFEKSRPSPFLFRTLDSVIDRSMEAPGKISDIWYDSRQIKSQAKLKFTGDIREISGKRKQLLDLWFEKNGFPNGASTLMAQEARFTDDDKEYWIGMRNTTLIELTENVKKGDVVMLNTILAGGIRGGDGVDWFFLAGQFVH